MRSKPKLSILIVGLSPKALGAYAAPALLRGVVLGSATCLLGGCGLKGAPSYSIFGAFFPAWVLCAGIGIAGSVGLRSVFIATGLESAMPLKSPVYVAFAVALALSIWLLLFWMS